MVYLGFNQGSVGMLAAKRFVGYYGTCGLFLSLGQNLWKYGILEGFGRPSM